MPKTQELIDQIDSLILTEDISSELNFSTNYDILQNYEDDINADTSNDTEFSNDLSLYRSNDTNRSSVKSVFDDSTKQSVNSISGPKCDNYYSHMPDNSRVYKNLNDKHENLNNVLDCLVDMLNQETIQLELELHKLVNEVHNSVGYNTHNIRLFN